MAITRNFKDTIQARALREPDFRQGLLTESIESMLSGDKKTGKSLLRNLVNAAVGLDELATITHKSPKKLIRMLSPSDNPTANNLFDIIHILQKKEWVHLRILAA